jgi:hypothetical protein
LAPGANQAYVEAEKAKAAAKPATPAPMPTGSGVVSPRGTSATSGTAGLGTTPTQETLNLPNLYKSLYASSGISDIEKEYSTKEKQYIEAKAQINDNPWLSEGTRVGRVAKLESLFNERTANLKNDIATKKADIETQIGLETKQFDINSQATQQAWSQLNTLLSMGALSGATGEDIANITRSTGISSDMIRSAIDASKKKDVKTSVIQSTNDAGVVTVSVVNSETGEVISQKSLGAIGNAEKATEPKALSIGQQKGSVEAIISSYIGNEVQQAQISPEDLYRELLIKYPESVDYLKENWTPADIRSATK